MPVCDAKRLQDLEAENAQLKKLLAESLPDAEALKVALGRKHYSTSQARGGDGDVEEMLEQPEISECCACLLGEISRTVLHYTPKVRLENEQLQGRMVELVSE